MSNNQKTPFAPAIQTVIKNSINDSLQVMGQALPCHVVAVNGAIVTINFDISTPTDTYPPVTCATIGSRYLRAPIAVGDKGICVPADAKLGGVTGLGLGLTALAAPSNLGALIFVPIGNVNWPGVDPTATVIISQSGASVVTVAESGISLSYGGFTVTINSSGINLNNFVQVNGSGVTLTGTVTINGRSFLAHEHIGVQTGSSVSGGVL
jgi:hypothetical protein